MRKWMIGAALAAVCAVSPVWADDDEEEAGPDPRPFVSIDVEHIENKTDNPGANFKAMIDRLNNDLTETGLWRVMDMKDMADAIKKNDQLNLAAGAKKIDNFETPGWMIKMAISMYGVVEQDYKDPLSGEVTKQKLGKVELILRVVDQKGETLKSKNVDSGFIPGTTTAATANLREQVLQEANKVVCKKIVGALIEMTPFYIADIENGVVNVDIGKPTVAIGMQMRVIKQGKGKKSKRTGKITKTETEVARIQITSATDEMSQAKIIGGEIKPGDDEDDPYKDYIVRYPDLEQDAANAPQSSVPQKPSKGKRPF